MIISMNYSIISTTLKRIEEYCYDKTNSESRYAHFRVISCNINDNMRFSFSLSNCLINNHAPLCTLHYRIKKKKKSIVSQNELQIRYR